MQRRFAIALVTTALVSILLVGFGVLAMAQLSARSNAEDQVERGLRVVGDLLVSSGRPSRQIESSVLGLRGDFGLAFLEPVRIDNDGLLNPIENRIGRGRATAIGAFPDLQLDEAQLAAIQDGETVIVSADRFVYGIRVLDVERLTGEQNFRIPILAGQSVTAVTRQTVAWFLLSSLLVLAGALLAGLWLAKRLTGPLKAIEVTTSAIADGNLAARVDPSGGDEVADLGMAVNRMAADLQRSKALDRQFLMSVSHDLKTPLTAISGYAEALRDGAITDAKSAGDVIGSHADRLGHLVGDLLDLARLDANRFALNSQTFDLAVVTGRSVAGMANRADRNGLGLERSESPPLLVLADPDRTAQAIGNLVDNAVGFATSRVLVQVAVAVEAGADHRERSVDGSMVAITVSDDGPGFDPDDLPFVFDRLYTGSAKPRRAESSTGLGLAIVRELVGAMGGLVTARNGPNGGAAIEVRLPSIDPSTDRASPADQAGSAVTMEVPTPRPQSHRPGASSEPPPTA